MADVVTGLAVGRAFCGGEGGGVTEGNGLTFSCFTFLVVVARGFMNKTHVPKLINKGRGGQRTAGLLCGED